MPAHFTEANYESAIFLSKTINLLFSVNNNQRKELTK